MYFSDLHMCYPFWNKGFFKIESKTLVLFIEQFLLRVVFPRTKCLLAFLKPTEKEGYK